jgi:hypothetical protein
MLDDLNDLLDCDLLLGVEADEAVDRAIAQKFLFSGKMTADDERSEREEEKDRMYEYLASLNVPVKGESTNKNID